MPIATFVLFHNTERPLVGMGPLAVDLEHYGARKLSSDCHALIRGEREVHLREDPETKKKSPKVKAKKTATNAPEDNPPFEVIRELRLGLSKEAAVTSFVTGYLSCAVTLHSYLYK